MCACRYINSLVQQTAISVGDPSATIGQLISEYEVKEYWDLRETSTGGTPAGLNSMRGYIVTARQKISIINYNANDFQSIGVITGYSGYPVLIVQSIQVSSIPTGVACYIEDYSPKTVNAAVSISATAATNASAANSTQRTSGSSESTTNSFEISDNVGFFGADPTGGVSASFGQSYTSSEESSIARGMTNSTGSESGKSSGMSIKDWCSFAFLDANKQQPSWVWAQEYPWNVLDFRSGTTSITLPNYVSQRLWDGLTLYPPSYLSQFGLDFTATARWIFYIDGAQSTSDELVTFTHNVTLWEGSHSIPATPTAEAVASLELATSAGGVTVDTVTLNLPVFSLLPIFDSGRDNGAIAGFVSSEFITVPTSDASEFRLKSSANNMYITGSGFDPIATVDSIFSASSITASAVAQYTIQFKVVSNTLELCLYIKHWKNSNAGCIMTLLVNEPDPSNPVNPIIRHVDAFETGSGSDNLTAVILRKKDYMSSEFFDYLIMGLNTISISISPADGQTQCGYSLRALSIG